MQRLKRNLGRYMEIGLAVLLVLAALYLPQGWFVLRDAASMGRVQGEALAPLMVAQLDRSYERDIYQRLRAYMEAYAREDVNCSSKEVDPGDESLWENISQAEDCRLMAALKGWQYVTDASMKGQESVIESCSQYVLMRKSDGQILLVANDILLDKGYGRHMELLIDGVDGTLYYLESEEENYYPLLPKWFDDSYAWDWWWLLNETYCTEDEKRLEEEYNEEMGRVALGREGSLTVNVYNTEYAGQYDSDGISVSDFSGTWVLNEGDTDIYCCLLTFGEVQDSWAMEIEKQEGEDYFYRIRVGLPGVVNSVPEMAERISLTEYDRGLDAGAGEQGDGIMP